MNGMTIGEAISAEASKRYFSFKAPDPMHCAPSASMMSDADWRSLSPGMRREIERDMIRRGEIEVCMPLPRKETFEERKARIEYAGRKAL